MKQAKLFLEARPVEPNFSANTHTRAGTIGGFLFALLLQVDSSDLAKTAILAAVGGIVSLPFRWALEGW